MSALLTQGIFLSFQHTHTYALHVYKTICILYILYHSILRFFLYFIFLDQLYNHLYIHILIHTSRSVFSWGSMFDVFDSPIAKIISLVGIVGFFRLIKKGMHACVRAHISYIGNKVYARDGIFKLLRGPGIDSKESIPRNRIRQPM